MEEKDGQLFQEEETSQEENILEEPVPEESTPLGEVRIVEDVIAHLAIKALQGVEGVQPAVPGFSAKLGLGRKPSGGVRISLGEGTPPEISVDTFVNTRYGLRIPDVAWNVQEVVKNQLEAFTGYHVKAVNVFVQGVFFGQAKTVEAEAGEVSSVRDEPEREESQEGETEPASPGLE